MTSQIQGVTAANLAPNARTKFKNGLFRDAFTLYRRSMIKLSRMPSRLYFTLMQPLIWLLLYGNLLSTFAGSASQQFGTNNYMTFFLPGIIIMTMLFGAAGSALAIITDDDTGYLNKLRVTPISRLSILLGNIMAELTRVMFQILILTVVAVMFGVRFYNPYLIPLVFLVALLFGLTIGSLGTFVGLATRNVQSTFLIINFFTLPLIFTSSAQLPINLMPEWLQVVARFNPITYAIDGMRAIVVGLNKEQIAQGVTEWQLIGISLLVTTITALLAVWLAVWKFRQQIK
jgi:ABC-2 type transport system permease protein